MSKFEATKSEAIPSPEQFDAQWYLETYPDVRALGMDPLEHYLWIGARLGRKLSGRVPSPGFANPDLKVASTGPIKDHVETLQARTAGSTPEKKSAVPHYELVAKSDYFDPQWYRSQYSDQLGAEDPIEHYLRIGFKMGFDPSCEFSTTGYLDIYRDIKAAKRNPLVHFLQHGKSEGRSAKPMKRTQLARLLRFSDSETGNLHKVLAFDGPPKPIAGIVNERIAVHVHLYYMDMVDDIIGHLRNIRHPFTLLVSVQNAEDPAVWRPYILGKLPMALDVIVRRTINRGRDVAPWVVTFANEVHDSTIFCHFHTKKSHHSSAHRDWARFMFHTILGSVGVVDEILEILCQEEDCGIVAPCYYSSLASQPNYGKNRDIIASLFARITPAPLPQSCPDYPAGSFFWAQTEVLKPLLDLRLTLEDFDTEAGQIDGTIAHGIERLIGLLPQLCGKVLRQVAVDVAFDLTRYISSQRRRVPVPFAPQVARPAAVQRKAERIAYYTSSTGDYETVAEILRDRKGADLFFFSDDPAALAPEGFSLRMPNYISPVPVRTARFVKTHPHVWFPGYDWAVWCDANLYFQGQIEEYIDIVRRSGADCGFIAHPIRETMFEEADAVLKADLVKDGDLVRHQTTRYLADLPNFHASRLIETGFFVCRLDSPAVARFMRAWWGEINRYSHRDQLSINYAIETTGLNWVKLLPEGRSLRDWDDFVLFAHSVTHRQEIINMTKVYADVA